MQYATGGVARKAEDATLSYTVHLFAHRRGLDYQLAHMTWAKLHNWATASRISYAGGPPGNESVAVHYLKPEAFPRSLRSRLHHLWAWMWHHTRAAASRRCWPLIRFEWRPADRSVRCLDPAVWWLFWRRCGSARTLFCRGYGDERARKIFSLDPLSGVWGPLFGNRTVS